MRTTPAHTLRLLEQTLLTDLFCILFWDDVAEPLDAGQYQVSLPKAATAADAKSPALPPHQKETKSVPPNTAVERIQPLHYPPPAPILGGRYLETAYQNHGLLDACLGEPARIERTSCRLSNNNTPSKWRSNSVRQIHLCCSLREHIAALQIQLASLRTKGTAPRECKK